MSSRTLNLALAAIAISLSMGTHAAGYLKIGDIKGESLNTRVQTQTGTGEPINGGLNRDIIRRTANSDNAVPEKNQTIVSHLPTGQTKLHGVEPDEID